ncbi:MAG TPA: hypothetical protein PLE99_02695 [Candidatus Thiothrix moscowensis]|uniref:hypothetical protein n=1 Tax=unclassified Thiothrix TaxID=2636184 RepID=UPI001A2488BC|nr:MULTISPECIES: hypothetical protein [unclassified Thiothrix]MBJ6609253.1 hypothetical protein [Candidatus Thiothrix moscowensis]HRJ51650.1 hypothetical protein [Candidatus Thiothrix moscowensis]HRJ91965.1 hypothetical protein [Candidatus Thiothrix moscowensis]
MNDKAKCWALHRCEKSLAFRFINIARWVALLLLVGIGVMGAYVQHQQGQDVSWVFVGVCVISGVMLFWMGRCLLKSECQHRQPVGGSCGKQDKGVATIKLSSVGKMR